MYSTESTGQKDRHTFFLQTRTDHGQTRHRGTHILSLSPVSSNSDPFHPDHSNRKIHPCAPAHAQGTRTPHRRSADKPAGAQNHPPLRFTPSPACFPWTLQSGDESGSLPVFGVLSSPLPSMDLLLGPSQTLECSPPYSTRRVPAAAGCSVAHPPALQRLCIHPSIHPSIHSFILFSPSLLHSFILSTARSAFHSFIPSSGPFPVLGLAHAPPTEARSAQARAGRGTYPPIVGRPPASRLPPASHE